MSVFLPLGSLVLRQGKYRLADLQGAAQETLEHAQGAGHRVRARVNEACGTTGQRGECTGEVSPVPSG